ncbi:hypothetical protein MAP00_001627 [Monascus purpureus]|nr:hypothetical protein MAP00_001627 [Monascus purpureus]
MESFAMTAYIPPILTYKLPPMQLATLQHTSALEMTHLTAMNQLHFRQPIHRRFIQKVLRLEPFIQIKVELPTLFIIPRNLLCYLDRSQLPLKPHHIRNHRNPHRLLKHPTKITWRNPNLSRQPFQTPLHRHAITPSFFFHS